ncbi:MAG: fibrobacter succinogenes major paralogous domain-containing protein [Fibromonadales bacterium]|nr:fibrobacter succinogenes major paralogous domain-containing protein [Fibromonadales bacterium]
MNRIFFIFCFLFLCMAGCKEKKEQAQIQAETFLLSDSRDGQEYKAVKIGQQIWMAGNLNYKTDDSWCYGNEESNCEKYGRLYTWNAAKDACPDGWHLPSRDEWNELVKIAGDNTAAKKLKSKTLWNGADNYEFSALPGGAYYNDGSFNFIGDYSSWWSATEHNNNNAYNRYMNSISEVMLENNNEKNHAYYVRCVQD